jgi:micrococcal nuclease
MPTLFLLMSLAVSSCQASVRVEPESTVSPITSPTLTSDVRGTTSSTTSVELDVVVEVVSVTDGDTIRVLMPDGTNEPVRLIGIDAPEDGSLLDQEATDYLEELVLGKDVRMVVDVSDRDRFDRLLRYIYVGDLFVNEEMVRAGLAIAKRYKPDIAMASVLEAAQERAEQGALGLFSVVTTTAGTTHEANCDSSYPDFCIPPPPPDLSCGDIGRLNFTVLTPDPHGFDGNNDGVGCES